MKSFIDFLQEDGVAVNNVGGGQIASVGIGPAGEPPGILPSQRKKKDKKDARKKD